MHNLCYIAGDGNEDVSCKMTSANWDVSHNPKETFTSFEAETFYDDLRCHFINYLIFPSIARQVKFAMKMDEVPPVVNALAAGDLLYNSEHLKDSKILKNRDKLFGNQEMLMHCLREGHLVLENLNSYSQAELTELCVKLQFENLSRYFFNVIVNLVIAIFIHNLFSASQVQQ